MVIMESMISNMSCVHNMVSTNAAACSTGTPGMVEYDLQRPVVAERDHDAAECDASKLGCQSDLQ